MEAFFQEIVGTILETGHEGLSVAVAFYSLNSVSCQTQLNLTKLKFNGSAYFSAKHTDINHRNPI